MNDITVNKGQLILPGFKVTQVGLVPNKTLTKDQWTETGHRLTYINAVIGWATGDWLVQCRGKWEQGSLEEICERFGLVYGTAANATSVCRALEFSRRRENLTFKHHVEVANRDDADELLDWCEETDPPRSVQDLRAEKRRRQKESARIPPPEGKYRVIYCDPPWEYGDERSGTDKYTSAEDHYSTMSLEELCEEPVKKLAHDNSVLFLWATAPLLPDAMTVITAWGFTYKASFVWDKVKHNVGHYNSMRMNFC